MGNFVEHLLIVFVAFCLRFPTTRTVQEMIEEIFVVRFFNPRFDFYSFFLVFLKLLMEFEDNLIEENPEKTQSHMN